MFEVILTRRKRIGWRWQVCDQSGKIFADGFERTRPSAKYQGERALFSARGDIFTAPIEKGPTRNLTHSSGAHDNWPSWSPDGSQIAFIRRHGEGDIDKTPNMDLFVVEAHAGAQARRLTTTTAEESGPVSWSPDGKSLAYLLGDELKYSAYDENRLAIIPAAGGTPRTLTDALDRPVRAPLWTADGSIVFTLIDDRSEYLARVPANGGKIDRLTPGRRVVSGFSAAPDGAFAVIASAPSDVPEIYAL